MNIAFINDCCDDGSCSHNSLDFNCPECNYKNENNFLYKNRLDCIYEEAPMYFNCIKCNESLKMEFEDRSANFIISKK